MKMAFLGAGKMATAIVSGLVRKGGMAASDISACDVSADAAAAFVQATGAACSVRPGEAFAGADCICLAVKPQMAEAAVRALPPRLTGPLVISIAAGIPIGRLQEWFGSTRVIRVMPNTPLLVGLGATVYALGPGASQADGACCARIFGGLGICREVPEAWIDAVTALSGSGPAYVFEMVQALVDAGVAVGLPGDLALELTVQTVAGAAEMLRQKQGTPEDLRRAVTSPGGTTAAGLAVLESAGFRTLVRETVGAACRRAGELGQAPPRR